MKKVAVVLSGCGVYDGSEIGEVMMTLLAIELNGGEYTIFAPDKEQYRVVNHLTGEQMPQSRNVLVESARIARGSIRELSEYDANNFDVLVFPGGFGAAQSLSTYAMDGEKMDVDEQVAKAIIETHKKAKPIAAMCIAPVILSKLIPGVKVTIGNDSQTSSNIKFMGGDHENKTVEQVCVDKKNKIYTTPCYMISGVKLSQVFEGAKALMSAVLA